MPTIDQIGDKIFRAKLYRAELVVSAIQAESTGAEPKHWDLIVCLGDLIESLTTLAVGEQYNLAATDNIYNQLAERIGLRYIDGVELDPNAQQSPGVVFIGNQPEQKFNTTRIIFVAATEVNLLNYPSLYYPLYGDNPDIQIWVSDGAGGFNADYGNAPDIQYVIPGDANSGIASIAWVFPIETTGYVRIAGLTPTT